MYVRLLHFWFEHFCFPPLLVRNLHKRSFFAQHDVDGKAYYTFEFTAQAPNFTRHALGAITIANGMNAEAIFCT